MKNCGERLFLIVTSNLKFIERYGYAAMIIPVDLRNIPFITKLKPIVKKKFFVRKDYFNLIIKTRLDLTCCFTYDIFTYLL